MRAKKKTVPKKTAPKKRIPKPHGRPSLYSEKIANEICERLSHGEPLAHICCDSHMPKVRTVSGWKESHPTFLADFARARDEGFDAIAAECLEIANTQVKGEIRKNTPKGIEVTTEDMLGHRKLQIETRLKLLAKWDPKRYGDKLDLNANVAGEIKIVIGGDV